LNKNKVLLKYHYNFVEFDFSVPSIRFSAPQFDFSVPSIRFSVPKTDFASHQNYFSEHESDNASHQILFSLSEAKNHIKYKFIYQLSVFRFLSLGLLFNNSPSYLSLIFTSPLFHIFFHARGRVIICSIVFINKGGGKNEVQLSIIQHETDGIKK